MPAITNPRIHPVDGHGRNKASLSIVVNTIRGEPEDLAAPASVGKATEDVQEQPPPQPGMPARAPAVCTCVPIR
ncbi:MAG: hypothetical protein ACOX35_01985 [Bacillota bacterium]